MAECFNLLSLAKSLQEISSEIEMKFLLCKIMQVTIENSGAQHCYLLINKNSVWVIIAKKQDFQPCIEFSPPLAINETDLISTSVVCFVAREQKKIVLDNVALQRELIKDPYFRNKKAKSLLCAPLLHKGKLVGIIYLENDSDSNTFTPDRVELLEILFLQAAISFENASIYQSLKESEYKYRQIVDSANEGILGLDANLTIIFTNNNLAEMIGFTKGEILGRRSTDFLFEIDISGHLERMINRQKGKSEQYEQRLRHKDGHEVWTLVSATPRFDEAGNFKGSFGMLADITERKKAEQNFALLNFAVDKFKDAVFLMDEDARFQLVNEEACNSLGYSRDELLAMRLPDIDPDYPMERWRENWRKLEISGSNRFETRHKTKSGHNFPVEISTNLVEYNGRSYHVAIARNIAKRRQIEEELSRYRAHLEELVDIRTIELSESNAQLQIAIEQAESASRAKSVFLANMSHELRTPLNAILGFARLMKEAPDITVEQRKNLDIITLSGGHLLNLINNILDLSKIESGRMTLEIAPVDLHQLTQEMKSLLYVNAMERGLNFIVEQSPELPRHIEADGGKLRQILINLIGNAIKYTKQGEIILRVMVKKKAAEQVRLRFEIEDTGMGISEEDSERIFKPFVQLHGQGAVETGTGLGLTISRQYVELMGGYINVISEKGKGSLFFFEIPVKELEMKGILEKPERGRVIGLEKGQPRYRLLIVEDQLENRILLRKILESVGFDIKEASNGKEAIKKFEQWRPDLIWMDIRMPVMDGLEATHRIKATEAGTHTKIIAITAQALEEEKIIIVKAGCDDFIRKPYQDTEIFDILTKHLGVRFIYEKIPITPVCKTEIELQPELLAKVPSDLVKELHRAVIGLNPERIQELINKIIHLDPEIGKTLQNLTVDLDYSRLLQLLDEFSKEQMY